MVILGTVGLWEVVPKREAATKVARIRASKDIAGCGFLCFLRMTALAPTHALTLCCPPPSEKQGIMLAILGLVP